MPIILNGLNITDNTNYLVEELNYKSMPTRNIESQPISTRPGDKLISYEWGPKEISIKGRIFGNNAQNLMDNVDTFQKNASIPFVSLSIDTNRSYTATLTELSIPNQFYTLTMAEYEAKFLCIDPFAYGTFMTVSGSVPQGTLTYSGTVTISGTVFAEPTLTVIPWGVSGDSGIQLLQIYHSSTGELLTVSGTMNKNTGIAFDYKNFTVTNNGASSDFQGIFSRFENGVVNFEITVVSGTNPGYDWVLGYQTRYYQ